MPRIAWAIPELDGTDGDGEWLAGDLHCHTVYSFDTWGPADPDGDLRYERLGLTPAEQIAVALSRGLAFLAITDHNTAAHMSDPGYWSDRVILVPGYEHSLRRGHAGLLGVRRTFDVPTPDDRGAARLIEEVHRAGGLAIANHPKTTRTLSWYYSSKVRPDAVEVWNQFFIGSELSSLLWWEGVWLARGRMPAVGGSDHHVVRRIGANGVGQPTTWVYARDRTWQAVLEGIRAGRTTISAGAASHTSAGRLTLSAHRGRRSWMLGDVVPGSSRVVLRAHALGLAGNLLGLVVNGRAVPPVEISSDDWIYETAVVPEGFACARASTPWEDSIPYKSVTGAIHFEP